MTSKLPGSSVSAAQNRPRWQPWLPFAALQLNVGPKIEWIRQKLQLRLHSDRVCPGARRRRRREGGLSLTRAAERAPFRVSTPGPAGASRRRARGRSLALGRGAPCRPGSRAHPVRSAGTQAGEPGARGQAVGRAVGRSGAPGRVGGCGTHGRAGERAGAGAAGARGSGRAGGGRARRVARGWGGGGGENRRPGARAAGARAARVINYARARAARGAGAGSAPRWRPPQSRPPQPRRLCSPAAPPGPRARAAAASPAAAAVSRPGALPRPPRTPHPGAAPRPGLPLSPRDPGAGSPLSSPELCRRAHGAARGPRGSLSRGSPGARVAVERGFLPFGVWERVFGSLAPLRRCFARGSRGEGGPPAPTLGHLYPPGLRSRRGRGLAPATPSTAAAGTQPPHSRCQPNRGSQAALQPLSSAPSPSPY